MKKLLLVIAVLFSFNANAGVRSYEDQLKKELADHNIKVEEFSKDDLREVLNHFHKQSVNSKMPEDGPTTDQQDMLNQIYSQLKNVNMNDPQMRESVKQAVKVIEQSGFVK